MGLSDISSVMVSKFVNHKVLVIELSLLDTAQNCKLPSTYTRSLLVLDLEHGLAKVAALEHVDEAVGGLVDALGEVDLGLDAAVGEPVGNHVSHLFPSRNQKGNTYHFCIFS